MADVPDQSVARSVEDVVQRDGQFDDAKPGAEMAPGDRDGVDHLLTQFVRKSLQEALVETAHVLRRRNLIEKRCATVRH